MQSLNLESSNAMETSLNCNGYKTKKIVCHTRFAFICLNLTRNELCFMVNQIILLLKDTK